MVYDFSDSRRIYGNHRYACGPKWASARIERNYYLPVTEPIVEGKSELEIDFIKPDRTIAQIEKPWAGFSLASIGATIVYFPLGKCSLTDDAHAQLTNLAGWLEENDDIVIEVRGHTDTNGPGDYNLILSQWRAEAATEFLVEHGVNRDQLITAWFGEDKPINIVQTPAGRTENRRVEFVPLLPLP